MRTDMTPAFEAAKNSNARRPRLLLVLNFPQAGPVYISDQEIELGGVTYLPLVEDWGELKDSVGPQVTFSAEVRQMTATFWNGGSNKLSDYFLQEDPENVEALLYQWFVGLADADKLLVERLVIQDPISFAENDRLLKLDFVSVNMRYVGRVGTTVTTEDWPHAMTDAVGKYIPVIYGNAGDCPTLCVRTAPMATLHGSIVKGSVTIECNEDLDELLFPGSGIVQVGDEKIQYGSRTSSKLYVQHRGHYGTEVVSHPDNAEVHLLINDHTYLLGEGVTAIANVKVEGVEIPSGIWSVDLSGDYGLIVFSEKPYFYRYAASSQVFELAEFDIAGDNSAWQAFYAFDENKTSSSAMINTVYPTLSLSIDPNIKYDMGLVVTAYLAVHHWETNTYSGDYVEVWVDGIGVVGRLSRPSADDVSSLTAQVDVVDPLDYQDPTLQNIDPAHPHLTGATAGVYKNGYPADFGPYGRSGSVPGDFYTGWISVYFYNLLDNAASSKFSMDLLTEITGGAWVYYIEFDLGDGNIVRYDSLPASGPNGRFSMAGNTWYKAEGTTWTGVVRFRIYGYQQAYGDIKVYASRPMLEYNHAIRTTASAQSGASTNISSPGQVNTTLVDPRQIEILSHKSPSRTLVDRFDISDYIDPSWDWFAGRKVQVRYVNAGSDAVNIFVPWITFEIEYRAKERVFSDKITATATGKIENRPDQVLQDLLTKSNLPASYVDAASFNSAGAEFATMGYKIDARLDGSLAVKDALKKVCYQTRARLFWSGALAKLAIRRTADEQTVGRYLGPDDYRLKSLKVLNRKPVRELVNYIELFYQADNTDPGKFAKSVIRRAQDSIDDHGQRDKPGDFLFDLVRDPDMAADVCEYYRDVLAYPSTFYEFITWLPHVDLEKEDIFALTSSGFNQLKKAVMRLHSVAHKFGSGKNKVINHLRIVAECLRYILLKKDLNDSVTVLDDLIAVLGEGGRFNDSAFLVDELFAAIEAALDGDSVTVTDTLQIYWEAVEIFTETVTVSDDLAIAIGMTITDTVNVVDVMEPWTWSGFGGDGFGQAPFGGRTEWGKSNPDEILMVDELLIAIEAALDDSVTVSDYLVASNGFGSTGDISPGFGNIPFGK